MSRKLAVVITGAVSLGSYEAGVMYEILEAIALHNEKNKDNDSEKIEIDVITGASAGGMTACLLAQHLLCGDQSRDLRFNNVPFIWLLLHEINCIAGILFLCESPNLSLRDPYENPLYKAWVKDVDIKQLLEVDPKDHKFSLLQSGVVENIGKKYLQDNPSIQNPKHPAAASEIRIGIAMSNLNGYEYNIDKPEPTQGTTNFSYTRYQDQFVCLAKREDNEVTLREMTLLENGDQDIWHDFRDTDWVELREVGLSSGAFPFAFKPRKIRRDGGKTNIAGKKNRFSQRSGDFWYVDGGVFENEPLGMAQQLVAQIDDEDDKGISQADRYYLLVAPGERTLPENPQLKPVKISSRFWQFLFNINTNACNLGFILFWQESLKLDLLKTGSALLSSIFQQARFQEWIVKGIKKPVISITANDFELLGDVFSAFAGFLEEKFRAYDYNIGREFAKAALNINNPSRSLLANLLRFERDDIQDIKWKPKGKIEGKNVTSWQEAKEKLAKLAKPLDSNQSNKSNKSLKLPELAKNRNQLEELKNLMTEVDLKTREKILKQLIARFDSLVIFIIEDKIFSQTKQTLDSEKKPNQWTWKKILSWSIKLLYCLISPFLKGLLIIWLKRNILNLPLCNFLPKKVSTKTNSSGK
ncbi:MAG: hypothetical protein Tsb0014_02260 [Pleurocapsa sp.]